MNAFHAAPVKADVLKLRFMFWDVRQPHLEWVMPSAATASAKGNLTHLWPFHDFLSPLQNWNHLIF